MSKAAAVVYWSGTGNTEAMAKAVAEGCSGTLITASDFSAADAANYDAIAFGCPAMGAEQLEDSEFEPMFESVKGSLAGKKVVLFGSYGWGGGEWMNIWADDCASSGITLAAEPVVCNEAPDASVLADCRKLGSAIA